MSDVIPIALTVHRSRQHTKESIHKTRHENVRYLLKSSINLHGKKRAAGGELLMVAMVHSKYFRNLARCA